MLSPPARAAVFLCIIVFALNKMNNGPGVARPPPVVATVRPTQTPTPTVAVFEPDRNVCTPIDARYPALVCPPLGYMGLTNILATVIDCALASAHMCGHVNVYLSMKVQHGSFFDLFNSSAIGALERNLSVRILFYCSDGEEDSFPVVTNVTECRAFKGPTVLEDARSLHLFSQVVYHVPYMWMLLQHPSDTVARFVRRVQDGIGGPYVGIHERFESDVWALTKFRTAVEIFYTTTLPRLLDALVLTHPNVRSWYTTGGNTPLADRGFRLKSEFIDVGKLSAPFIAFPRGRSRDGRRMNVTNSTGALVDFLLVMGAAASLSARYSKFGSLLCSIRRRYVPEAPTYTYGTAFGLKSCSEKGRAGLTFQGILAAQVEDDRKRRSEMRRKLIKEKKKWRMMKAKKRAEDEEGAEPAKKPKRAKTSTKKQEADQDIREEVRKNPVPAKTEMYKMISP